MGDFMHMPVNMFWEGSELGELEIACMYSFVRHGHKVILHSYKFPSNTPSFVEKFDASELMPHDYLISNRLTGSVALGADRYRYLLLEAGMGLYADCDMFCLKKIEERQYIFGWEFINSINNAILKYPAGSELSRMLLEATSRVDFIPPWLRRRERLLLKVRRSVGIPRRVDEMPWGVWGPKLLTYTIKKLSLEAHASPIDEFYPVPGMHFPLLFDPQLSLEDIITPRTSAIHLWNNMFRLTGQGKRKTPPSGSAMSEIYGSAKDASLIG